jgi:hypothetical protein
MFELKGVVKVVNDTIQVSEKFSKREFVLIVKDGEFSNDIVFQASQDKISFLDGIQKGQELNVKFNLRGREWISPQGDVKYFNTLDAWKIEKIGQSEQSAPMAVDDNLPF